MEEAFERAGRKPRIVCSATDADVCKTYVEVGLGISVLATLAIDPKRDRGLVALDAGHLFPPAILNLVFRKHSYITPPLELFLSIFAPHFSRELILRTMEGGDVERTRSTQEIPVAG